VEVPLHGFKVVLVPYQPGQPRGSLVEVLRGTAIPRIQGGPGGKP